MARRFKAGDEPVPGYKLVEFLGRGGFGEVWKAAGRGVDVALKIIDLGGKTGYKEFKALKLVKLIRHPNLVPIVGFWLTDEDGTALDESQVDTTLSGLTGKSDSALTGTVLVDKPKARATELIIAMGLGDMSMADRLEYYQKKGLTGVPASELLDYMQDAARGIDFLNSPVHDLGDGPHSAIRHCDIKPQNMMIVGGAVQVCDFGLARAESDVRLTSAAVSPAYGAPECIDGNLPTPTTDQYSLAVSYVEMRTGSLPFSDPGSYMGVVKAHLTGNLDLDRLPPDEREVIRKATSRDPAERFANCQKFVKALRQACPSDDSVLPPPLTRQDLSPYQATMLGDSAVSRSSVSGSGSKADAPWRTPSSKDTQRLSAGKTPLSDSWRTKGSRFDSSPRRGVPLAVKILALLVLVGAVAGGAGAWYYLGNPARAERAKAEAFKLDVGILAHGGKYSEAFAKLSEAPEGFPAEDMAWLKNDQIYVPWLAKIQKDHTEAKSLRLEDRGTQLAAVGKSLDELLNAFPSSKDAGDLRSEVYKDLDDIAPQMLEQFRKQLMEIVQAKKYNEALAFIGALPSSVNEEGRSTLRSDVREAWLPDVRTAFESAKNEQDRAKRLAALEKNAADLGEMRKHFTDDAAIKALDTQVQSKLAPLKGGSKVEEHLTQAETHWGAKKWDDVSTSLKAAREAAREAGRDDLDGGRIEEFEKLVVIARSENPSDIRAAIDYFRSHLQEGSVERLAELAEAVKLLAARQPEFIADATEITRLVRELADASQNTALSGSAGETYQTLLVDRVLAAINSTEPIDFDKLRVDCDEAIAAGVTHPMVRLCQAECLVSGKATNADRQAAASAVGQMKDPIEPDHDLYDRYVRSVISASSTAPTPDWKKIGDQLDKVVAGLDASPWGLRSPTRLARLARLLGETAQQYRSKKTPTGSIIVKLKTNPFTNPATAERVFNWLQTANRLSAEPSADESGTDRVSLQAMAAGNKTTPELNVVTNAITELKLLDLQPRSTDEQHLLYLGGKLQPDTAVARLAKMQLFSRLLDNVLGAQVDPDDALPIYQELIHPLLALPWQTNALSKDDRAMLARLYDAKGQLIRYHPYVEWPFEDKLKQGYDAYNTAVALDPTNAAYWVGKGFAGLAYDRIKYDTEAMDCAKKAIELLGKYAGGFALKGNVLLVRARQQTDPAKREAMYRDTWIACERSVKLATPADPGYGRYLIHFSTAGVELANYLRNPDVKQLRIEQDKLLNESVRAAEQAKDSVRLYKEHAYRALGNAYEDLVWLVNPRDPDRFHYYDDAIEAFDEAIKHRSDLADQYYDRGRCFYKRVAYSGQDKAYLDDAVRDLKEATNLDPEHASAYRWLAMTYVRLKQEEPADEAFTKAKELARKTARQNPADYQLYALQWAEHGKDRAERRSRAESLLEELGASASSTTSIDRGYRNDVILLIGESVDKRERVKLYTTHLDKDSAAWKPEDTALVAQLVRCRADTLPAAELATALDEMSKQLTSASKIATSARQRSEVYEAAGHLYGACARDRQDTPSKTRDWKTSVEQYSHAFKLIADHPAPLELCNSYAYALLQLMTVDPESRKDPTKRAAMKAAFDAALERATGANIKSELRLKQAAYEKKLGAL